MELVSIIIPTYNRAHLLGETLNSVINQTYQKLECLVIDDGSTDYTEQLMEFYCDKDQRIKFFQRPSNRKKGASACRNYGIEKSTGEYIQFLDSDDLISINKISEQVGAMLSESEVDLVTCKWGRFVANINEVLLFEDLKVYQDFSDSYLFLNTLADSKGYFPLHAYLLSKNVIIKSGWWNEYISLNDDGEFMSRVIANSRNINFANNVIAYYRCSQGDNLSAFNTKEGVVNSLRSWKLIVAYLEIRYNKKDIYFSRKSKETFYINLKKYFPELILQNKDFFDEAIKKEKRCKNIYFRIISKLKTIS